MTPRKLAATNFEQLIVEGKIDQAYEQYIGPDFIHHNPYIKSDRASFQQGMIDNAGQFPDKVYELKRVIEEGDLVMTHARLRLSADQPEVAVVHIYRFNGDKIVEEWDLAQPLPPDSTNELGMF